MNQESYRLVERPVVLARGGLHDGREERLGVEEPVPEPVRAWVEEPRDPRALREPHVPRPVRQLLEVSGFRVEISGFM